MKNRPILKIPPTEHKGNTVQQTATDNRANFLYLRGGVRTARPIFEPFKTATINF